MWIIFSALFLIAPLKAEIWERPAYIPDENHLPVRRIQEEQERPYKKVENKQQKEKKSHLYKGRAPQHVTPKDP